MNIRTGLTLILLSALAIVALTPAPAIAATYYVDGKATGANNGSSWTDAYLSIGSAEALMDNAAGANLCLIRGDYKYSVPSISCAGLSDTERQVFRGVPGVSTGQLPIINGGTDWNEASFAATSGYPNVYWIASTRIYNAWEGPLGGEWGYDWTRYNEVATLALCQSTPNTFVSGDGATKLYVHTSNGTHPSNFILKTTAGGYVLVSSAYVSFERLVMRHNRYSPFLPWTDTGHSLNFISNICHHIGNEGLRSHQGDNCRYIDNTVHDVYTGVGTVGATNLTISGNTIYNCLSRGVSLSTSVDTPDSAVISDNTIHNCAGNAVYINDGLDCMVYGNTLYSNDTIAVYLDSGADNALIYDNTVYDNDGTHIFLSGADNAIVYNNFVSGGAGDGIAIGGSTGCSVYNNTVYGCGDDAIVFSGACNPSKVFNNNLWAVGSAIRICIYVDPTAQTGFSSDYNNIYYTDTARAGEWSGSKFTLADWQSSSGQDANSFSADPLLLDTASTPPNLHLSLAASPCIGAGVASFSGVNAPTTDIAGDARPLEGSYDIGADEYMPRGSMFMVQ